ncbi:MAG: ComEA family DNA-binding protein [Thalassotalea sp.]|nr:ComEA family DNA-binding protein [Thalassotalea sp.]
MKNQIRYFLTIILALFSFQSFALDDIQSDSEETSVNIMVININQAESHDFLSLKGVGVKKAQAIVTYRQTNGPFATIDDLLKVQGIGKHVIAENKNRLKI